MQNVHEPPVLNPPGTNSFAIKKTEIDSEEEHVLGVTGRPAVRIAHLQKRTSLGPCLLDIFLDEFIDELGNYKADCEENALEFATEDEMRNETAEADENRDERDPSQEVAQLVALLIAHVREFHGL